MHTMLMLVLLASAAWASSPAPATGSQPVPSQSALSATASTPSVWPTGAPVPARMVDGTDAREQPKPRVRGVPAPQPAPQPAQPAPAQAPRYYYPYPVIVNVYNYQPAPDPGPDYENAYFNPIAPVYYVSWPEYFWRGNFYPWGIYRPYPNPPAFRSCHYRWEYGAIAKIRRENRRNIHYNYRLPCRLP